MKRQLSKSLDIHGCLVYEMAIKLRQRNKFHAEFIPILGTGKYFIRDTKEERNGFIRRFCGAVRLFNKKVFFMIDQLKMCFPRFS